MQVASADMCVRADRVDEVANRGHNVTERRWALLAPLFGVVLLIDFALPEHVIGRVFIGGFIRQWQRCFVTARNQARHEAAHLAALTQVQAYRQSRGQQPADLVQIRREERPLGVQAQRMLVAHLARPKGTDSVRRAQI